MKYKILKFVKWLLRINTEEVLFQSQPFTTSNLEELTSIQKEEYLNAIEKSLKNVLLTQIANKVKINTKNDGYSGKLILTSELTILLPIIKT